MKISDMTNLEKCTGCEACVNACPTDAIVMKNRQRDGFYYPQVEETKCVDCGRCHRVCPIGQQKTENESSAAFVLAAKDAETRTACSSGGIFKLCAERILQQGGVVFGAAYDASAKRVIHCSTEEVPLKDLLRSKYVQSQIGHSFRQVKGYLKQGRTVLFSGTPCQIRGLKEYLSCESTSGTLLTMDFMCHGVPSPGFFQDFVESLEKKYKKKVNNVTFREKDLGWRTQVTKVYFENGTVWKRKSLCHYYYSCFLHDYSLRDSCYTCTEYAAHKADITLADCWTVKLDSDDDKGISLVIVNTPQGERFLEAILPETDILKDKMPFTNYSVYAHTNYKPQKKKLWQKVRKLPGFKTASTALAVLSEGRNLLWGKLRTVAGKIKKIALCK